MLAELFLTVWMSQERLSVFVLWLVLLVLWPYNMYVGVRSVLDIVAVIRAASAVHHHSNHAELWMVCVCGAFSDDRGGLPPWLVTQKGQSGPDHVSGAQAVLGLGAQGPED